MSIGGHRDLSDKAAQVFTVGKYPFPIIVMQDKDKGELRRYGFI